MANLFSGATLLKGLGAFAASVIPGSFIALLIIFWLRAQARKREEAALPEAPVQDAN